jgi:hypothetical protein
MRKHKLVAGLISAALFVIVSGALQSASATPEGKDKRALKAALLDPNFIDALNKTDAAGAQQILVKYGATSDTNLGVLTFPVTMTWSGQLQTCCSNCILWGGYVIYGSNPLQVITTCLEWAPPTQ